MFLDFSLSLFYLNSKKKARNMGRAEPVLSLPKRPERARYTALCDFAIFYFGHEIDQTSNDQRERYSNNDPKNKC